MKSPPARPRPTPPRLYVIADAEVLGGADRLPQAVEELGDSGVRWIQLRAKRATDEDLERALERLFSRREQSGLRVDLWMNDRTDFASLFPFRGVHLGQRDLPSADARRVLGLGSWIGRSTHDGDQLAVADQDPNVDVVAVGPVFATASKDDPDPVVGLDFIRRARRSASKPLIAIGGLDASNLALALEAGADCVAILGAACRGDLRANARRLLAAAGAL